MKAKITFRGWSGHFICSYRCQFRLNTLIECGARKVVVSTVGRMLNADGMTYGTIGADDRYFETMAFKAKRKQGFWDADVSRPVNFKSPWAWNKVDQEQEANDGHYRVVAELARKMERGAKL